MNAHLAAFDEMFDKRNADFHDLSRRLFFDSAVIAVEDGPPSGSWYTPAPVPLELFETDALFWLVSRTISRPFCARPHVPGDARGSGARAGLCRARCADRCVV